MKQVLLMALAALTLTACQTTTTTTSTTTVTPSTPTPTVTHTRSTREVMQQNRETWQIANFRHYSYQLRRSCYCTPEAREPVILEVVKDQGVVQARFARNNQPLSAELAFRKQTIDDLFDLIDKAIDRNAYRIKVDYHPEHGYPTSIFIDYDQRMADEETSLTVSDLKAL